ncbi:hypothetical protein CR513_38010, partial [Mucuna pruriens]
MSRREVAHKTKRLTLRKTVRATPVQISRASLATQAQLTGKPKEMVYSSVRVEGIPLEYLRQPTPWVCKEMICNGFNRKTKRTSRGPYLRGYGTHVYQSVVENDRSIMMVARFMLPMAQWVQQEIKRTPYEYNGALGIRLTRSLTHPNETSYDKVLTTHSSGDFLLPGDNYPRWLAYIKNGYSVPFEVPVVSGYQMKGMTLCVVYSSTAENKATGSLVSVFIINHTQCTIQICKQATTMSFTDEDWQWVISNLRPGDNVEIFVAMGHGITVKNTAVYLIYGQSITTRMESSPEVSIQPSSDVEMEPSSEVSMQPSSDVEMEPSLNVQMEPSKMPKKKIHIKITKKIRGCLCLN